MESQIYHQDPCRASTGITGKWKTLTYASDSTLEATSSEAVAAGPTSEL